MNGRWLLPIAVAVAVVQIGFLFSMIAGRAAILRDGREVMLKVEPVDPRDLLRGDYVVLGYNISQVPVDLFVDRPLKTTMVDEHPVFVRLRQGDDGIWQPVAARYGEASEPAAADEIEIRGMVNAASVHNSVTERVRYGIERFYVPEGEGRAIEAGMRERDFRMKVAVASDGAAQIKSFHDGETLLYAEPFY